MTTAPELGEQVPEDEHRKWVAAAHTARLARYALDQIVDPKPSSDLAGDDAGYAWEKCSAWMRSYLAASSDHLLLWANVVAPQQVFDGQFVQNPPRPYYTLARAGLESAAQAVWVLEESKSTERVHRHLRLLYEDFRQLALAFEASGDNRATVVRERMNNVETRLPATYSFDSVKKGAPKYSTMVRECAPAIKMQPSDLEVTWRGASAAAHGKNWFQNIGYRSQVGEEYEPGYFRVSLQPDPVEITKAVEAAAAMLMRGVVQFVNRCGHNPAHPLQQAMIQLQSETPVGPTPPD